MEEENLQEDDPAVEYWIPFIKRMAKIPTDYQMAILDEYEKAENMEYEINVEKIWDLLLEGEDELRSKIRRV